MHKNSRLILSANSGQSPIFEEGNIFRTLIRLKRIATQKVGRKNVPHDVSHDVPHNAILKNRLSLVIYGDCYYCLCRLLNVMEWRLL